MNKQEFLARLRKKLSGLPNKETEDRLTFYSEMIDDRMEEGLLEPEAVSAIGSVDEIAAQIIDDTPLFQITKEKIKPEQRLNVLKIILLVIGSPVWVSLAISAGAVILSLFIVLWSVIISLWAVFVSLIVCALGGAAAAIVITCYGYRLNGIILLSVGIICTGLSILMFYGCKTVTKGSLILTKKTAQWIKKCMVKKEEAK